MTHTHSSVNPATYNLVPSTQTFAAMHSAATAQQLRTALISLEPTHYGERSHSYAVASTTLPDLVDVRQAAPTLVILSVPSWSDPEQRFFLRPELAERLRRASYMLPGNLRIGFWEGYRPLTVQQALWETGLTLLRRSHPYLNETQLEALVEGFVARPDATALHSVGRAVDIAVLDSAGRVLDVESSSGKLAYGLFAQVLNRVGLANYAPEWWHWSYEPNTTSPNGAN